MPELDDDPVVDTAIKEKDLDEMDNTFQPLVFEFVGLQHVMDNLLKDVHFSLEKWDELHADYKVIERLLGNDESRCHYIMTCLRGTRWAYMEDRFKRFCAILY